MCKFFNPFMMEADIIYCSANQWTGFCMISGSVMKGLTKYLEDFERMTGF